MMRSASVTSSPASDRPATRPSSHALPAAPAPARTRARVREPVGEAEEVPELIGRPSWTTPRPVSSESRWYRSLGRQPATGASAQPDRSGVDRHPEQRVRVLAQVLALLVLRLAVQLVGGHVQVTV